MEIAMVYKLVALSIFFGLILAEPIRSPSFEELGYVTDENTEARSFDLLLPPDVPSLVSHLFNTICSLIGYKHSALSLAATAIDWLVSNSVTILLGTVATLGFCKLTGKCTLALDHIAPVRSLHDLATPERLRSAEEFLFEAVQKYADEKKKRAAVY